MKTSSNGIALICQFEGFENTAYLDSVGVLTIGYGHTSMAGPPVVKSGMTITDQEGKDILALDLAKFEAMVLKCLMRSPSQNQFDAMVSLCYNIGEGNFSKSTVVRQFNAGDFEAAANGFSLWIHAGGKVLPGLVTRRGKEMVLFKTPSKSATAPSPIPAPTIPKPRLPMPAPYSLGPIAAFLAIIIPIILNLFKRIPKP